MMLWNMSPDSKDTGSPLRHSTLWMRRGGSGDWFRRRKEEKGRWRVPSCLAWCDSSFLSGQVSWAAADTLANRINFTPLHQISILTLCCLIVASQCRNLLDEVMPRLHWKSTLSSVFLQYKCLAVSLVLKFWWLCLRNVWNEWIFATSGIISHRF